MEDKKIQVFNFIRNNNKNTTQVIKFLNKNNIDFAYFENIEELFNYYDEDNYKSFSNNIIDIIFKTGELIKILN